MTKQHEPAGEMEFFDSHCHFDFEVFDPTRDALWRQCNAAGITRLLIPGVAPAQWQTMLGMVERFPGLLCAVGLHPWWIDREPVGRGEPGADIAHRVAANLGHDGCVAVGECGLDSHIDTPLEVQRAVFEAQVQLACDYQLPLVVHVRGTHREVLHILTRHRPGRGGVIHGFSGSAELAAQYWSLGFCIGVGGTITYERAGKTRRAVARLPAAALLLETDAPDMPLCGFQGQPNTPLRIPQIARTLADLRAQPLAEIARQTSANGCRLFGVSPA